MNALKVELLRLLEQQKRRLDITMAQRAGAIVVHNRDGSVTAITVQFVESLNGKPGVANQLRNVALGNQGARNS